MFKIKCFIVMLLLSTISLADGFIIMPQAIFHPVTNIQTTPFPLEIKYHNVDVNIDEQIASTSIDQEFYNPTNYTLEGFYIFPIPKNAVIKNFSMYINGKEMKAELLGAKKAKKIFEDIVRQQMDPALLEYQNRDIFKLRIFPIEPKSTKRIKIEYKEVIKRDNGNYKYLYPLNTEKFSAKPLNEVSVNVNIKSKNIIKNIYSPSHDVNIERKNSNNAKASFKDKNVTPDTDFIIYYNTDKSDIGISLLNHKVPDEDGYFFMDISPGFINNNIGISEKDITFVIDNSGSMAGKKLRKAKKALEFCINNLNKGDRFEIIRFSTDTEELFSGLGEVNAENIKKAKKFINKLKPIGGTNIEEALSLAVKNNSKTERTHIIIFITDGKPTIGETKEENILKIVEESNIANKRIFTFGIGEEINTHLLDKITEITKSYRSYILPDEDIELKISNFYEKIRYPVFTNIEIKTNGIKFFSSYPKKLPDLFKGESLSIIGRYKENLNNIEIKLIGKVNNKEKTYKYNIDFKTSENDFIASLWATRRVGYLLDQIRLHKEEKEIIDEIVSLAKKYGIITPYTSYLIVEDEEQKFKSGDIDKRDQFFNKKDVSNSYVDKELFKKTNKSGKLSINASREFQSLNKTINLKQTKKKSEKLKYKDSKGKTQSLSNDFKNIQGRAIYNTNNKWVDSKVQVKNNFKKFKIKFASKKYFDLLNKNPEVSEF